MKITQKSHFFKIRISLWSIFYLHFDPFSPELDPIYARKICWKWDIFSIFQTLWIGLHLDWLTSIEDLNYCCIDNSTISFCFWESQIGKSLKKIIDYSSFCRRPRTFAWCGFVFLRSVFGVLRVIRAFDQFQIAVIATFQSLQLIYRSHPLKTILNGKVMALHSGLNFKILFENHLRKFDFKGNKIQVRIRDLLNGFSLLL